LTAGRKKEVDRGTGELSSLAAVMPAFIGGRWSAKSRIFLPSPAQGKKHLLSEIAV